MPQVFCLSENAEASLELISKMRSMLLNRASAYAKSKERKSLKAKPISAYYDFATMNYISPSAALVLASLYHHAKWITGTKLHTINEDEWAPQVKETLSAVGFHELLEMKRSKAPANEQPEILIQKFTSGSHAEGEPVGRLQEVLANLLPTDLADKLRDAEPYGGMFEAILNSHSWAYPEDYNWEFPALRNWWLTGAVDAKAGRVTVVVFDQGVSIPYSLPHWAHWGKLEARARRLVARTGLSAPIGAPENDGIAIRLAMTISKSQTNLPQHGKGLHTMIEVAQRARHGKLRIISRNGEYVWETGMRPKTATYRNPIGGTLIEWTLDL